MLYYFIIMSKLETLPEDIYFELLYKLELTELKNLCQSNKRLAMFYRENKDMIAKHYFNIYNVDYKDKGNFIYSLGQVTIGQFKNKDGTFNLSKLFRLYLNQLKKNYIVYNHMPVYKTIEDLIINDSIIEYIPKMPKLEELEIYSVKALKEIHDFPNLNKLILDRCPDLLSITKLPKIYSLTIDECEKLSELDYLYGLEVVKIKNCRMLRNLPEFGDNLLSLKLISLGMSVISNILIKDLEFIKIKTCWELIIIDTISSVDIVIKNCPNLLRISNILSTTIDINGCPGLEEINDCERITDMAVRNCESLSRLPYIESLVYLLVDNCPSLEYVPKYPLLKEIHCFNNIGFDPMEYNNYFDGPVHYYYNDEYVGTFDPANEEIYEIQDSQ